MNYITKSDIHKFGSYKDRKNAFDDGKDVKTIINFLKSISDNNSSLTYKEKPFGDYDVDLGVYHYNKLVVTVDVERWSSWNEEWPKYYRCVSFLGRKEKFLKRSSDFLMAYFNFDLSKVLLLDKKSILKYPTIERHTKGKLDLVKEVSFDEAKLYGSNITEREKTLFKHHHDFILK